MYHKIITYADGSFNDILDSLSIQIMATEGLKKNLCKMLRFKYDFEFSFPADLSMGKSFITLGTDVEIM